MPHILGVKLTSQQHYSEAVKLYEDGDYDGAQIHFGLIDDTDVANLSNAKIYLERILRRHPETAELTRLGAAATEQDFVNQVNNRIAIAARLKQEGDQTGSYVNYQKALDLASEGMRQIRMGGGSVSQLDALRKSLQVPGVMPDYRFAPRAEGTSAVQELVGTAPTSPDAVTQADDTRADILQTSYVDIMGEEAEPLRSRPGEYQYQISQLLGGIDPETGRPAFGTPAMRAAQRGLESGFQGQHTNWLLESAAQPLGQVTQFDDWLASQGIQRTTGDKLSPYWQEVIKQSSLFPTLSEQQSIEFIQNARALPLFGTPTADGKGFTGALSDEQKWAARAAMGGATTGLFGRINNQRFNSLLAAWNNLQNNFPDNPEYSSPQFLRWVVSQLTPNAPGYLENYSSREAWIEPPGGEDEGEAKKIAESVSNVGINIDPTNVQKNIGGSSDSSEPFLSSTSTPRYGYNVTTPISRVDGQPVEPLTPDDPYAAWKQLVEKHTPSLTGQALTDQENLNLAAQQNIQEAFKEFVPAKTSFGQPPQDPRWVLSDKDRKAYDLEVINARIRAAGGDPFAQYEVDLPMGSGGLTPNQERDLLYRLQTGIGIESTGMGQEVPGELGALTPNQERDLLYRLQTGTEESTGMGWERPPVPEVAAVPSTVGERAAAADIATARLAGNIRARQYNLGPYQIYPSGQYPLLQGEVVGDPFLRERTTPQIFPTLPPSPYAGLMGALRQYKTIPTDPRGVPHQWVNPDTGVPYGSGERPSEWELAPAPSIYDYMDAAKENIWAEYVDPEADTRRIRDEARNRMAAISAATRREIDAQRLRALQELERSKAARGQSAIW